MNFPFDASKAQQTAMNPQMPAAGSQGFTAGTTGAGDAGKMLSTGFSLPSVQSQGKPGGLFGSTLGGAPASTFGSPAATVGSGQAVGLNLGAPATATPGLSFGTPAAQATGLNFGMGGAAAPSTGFGAAGFTPGGLGTTGATSTLAGLSFAVSKPPATSVATGLSLGTVASAPTAMNPPKLSFGGGAPATPANSGFSLGGIATTTAVPAPSTTGTSFGLATPVATSTQQPGVTIGTTTSATGFNLASTTGAQSLASSFGIGQNTGTTAATTASTGFSLQGNTATPLSSGFNLGNNPASTISSGFTLNKTTTTQAPPSAATTNAPQTSLGTVTTVSSASVGQTGTMNFCQLEESINKWTLELEEQEKVFVNQATQVNNWDKLLIANGEKIANLNEEVERVKLEQQQLEHELDYVVGQQKELQDCLVPLEKELASLTVTDPERDYTYRLAENLDKQLKTMSQDLKEIIEHLNEANRSQDSSDPIVQIGKILNAHMNSLQWIDQRTSLLSQKIQQIDQMHQNFRQENERSFSLAYN